MGKKRKSIPDELRHTGELQAKETLSGLLRYFTTGRLLGLLGELHGESAAEAEQDRDTVSAAEFRAKRDMLDIVGTGLDARYPE